MHAPGEQLGSVRYLVDDVGAAVASTATSSASTCGSTPGPPSPSWCGGRCACWSAAR